MVDDRKGLRRREVTEPRDDDGASASLAEHSRGLWAHLLRTTDAPNDLALKVIRHLRVIPFSPPPLEGGAPPVDACRTASHESVCASLTTSAAPIHMLQHSSVASPLPTGWCM